MRRFLQLAVVIFFCVTVLSGYSATEKTAVSKLAACLPADAQFVVGLNNFPSVINALCDTRSGYGFAKEFVNALDDELAVAQANLVIEKALEFSGFLSGKMAVSLRINNLDDTSNLTVCVELRKDSGDELIGWLKDLGVDLSHIETTDTTHKIYELVDINLFLSIHNDLLFFSGNKQAAMNFAQGKSPYEKSLAENVRFKDTAANLRYADLMVYCDLGDILDGWEKSMTKLGREMYLALGLDKFRALGISYHVGADVVAGCLDITISDTSCGLPAMICPINNMSEAIQYVPADYELVWMLSTEHIPQAWQAYLDFVRKVVDDIGWQDYQTLIENVEKKWVLNLENDIITNFNGEVVVAVKVPELIGIPKVLIVADIKSPDATERIINNFTGETATAFSKQAYGEAMIFTIYSEWGVPTSFTVLENRLILSQSPTFVMEAIDAYKDGSNITSTTAFVEAASRVSDKNIFFYFAHTQKVIVKAVNLIPAIIGKSTSFSEGEVIIKLLEEIKPYCGDLGASAISVSFIDNHLTLRTASTTEYYKLKLRVGYFFLKEILIPSIGRARDRAKHIICMTNMKKLFTAMVEYANDHNGKLPDKLSDLCQYFLPPGSWG